MDETLTVGGGTTIGSTVTESPEQTPGVGDVDPNTGKTPGASEGGEEQSVTEGGQSQAGARRKWSIQDEVKELRAQRRELRERLSSFDQVRDELAQLREELNRQRQPGTAKTPANFWQDPDERFRELKEEIANQNQGILDAFQRTREQEFQAQALRQEQASAVEFIRTQQGYDPSDDEDLIEIIEAVPNRQHLSPQWVAEYAWMKLNKERGVGDRSLAKRQAAGVQGQPPGASFGSKRWSKAEFDQAVDMLEKNPHDPKNSELLKELESAWKEGRVK